VRRLIDRFLSVLSLVCRVSVPRPKNFDLSRTDFFFPLIGLLAAAAAGIGAALGALVLPGSALAAALGALGLQYYAFNLFHLDGLLDSADALLPAVDRERCFAILKDSRIGSYAFAAGLFVIAVKALALAEAIRLASGSSIAIRLSIFAYPVAGRAAAAFVPLVSKPAKKEVLGSSMTGFSPLGWAAGSALALSPFGAVLALGPGAAGLARVSIFYIVCTASACAVGLALSKAYRAKLGGFTGDALGASVELAETLFLVLGVAILARL